MTEHGPQGSSNPAKQEPSPPIFHQPDFRADADRKKTAYAPQRPRKFLDGDDRRKKNDQGIAEWDVHVVSARYDEERQSWMYTLTDCDQKAMSGETEETRLC